MALLGPIFNREVLTVPRRERHHITRVAFLVGLWILCVTAGLALLGWQRAASLGETARFGPVLFQVLTYVELVLFLFFAALAAASAVAQEKDRRTFILLLMTDLRNHEIVLGKLFGSLLPTFLLLLGSLPILMFLILLGGIALHQVLHALLVILTTAVAAGSVGGLVALWRERTFQSLALTVLFLVLYLCLVRALPLAASWAGGLDPVSVARVQQWLDPFLALASVHDPFTALEPGLPAAYGFAAVALGASVLLNAVGVWRLRVWNPSGEPIMQREAPETAEDKEKELALKKDARASVHAAPGKARRVGPNPILWRETATRAYGRRPLLVKLAYFIVLAFICYSALAPIFFSAGGTRTPYLAAYGLIPVGVLSLLLVVAQATTSITSERDIGALDLLLVTDLTPREFIFGKLGGILWNTKEYLIPPFVLAAIYAWHWYLATPPRGHEEDFAPTMNLTSFLCVAGAFVVLLGFTLVLGVHIALRNANSRVAIFLALSTIFFLSVGTLICIFLILINRRFEYQWGSFVFFLVAGIGGFWWVLNGERASPALTIASIVCPLAVLYTVMTILIGKPGTEESADPLIPFAVIALCFGFAVTAMLVPLLSEFDVALGRTSGGAD